MSLRRLHPKLIALLISAFTTLMPVLAETELTDYQLEIRIDPAAHLLDVQTEIQLPQGTRRLRIRFETNAGAYATVGSDGGSLGSHYLTIDADSWFDIRPYCSGAYGSTIRKSGCSIYLSSGTGSTVVQLQATESDG